MSTDLTSDLRPALVDLLLAMPAGYVYGSGDSKYLRTPAGDAKRTPEVDELMCLGLACRGLRGVPEYPVVPTDAGLREIRRRMNGAGR